jgi:hypothetical protein
MSVGPTAEEIESWSPSEQDRVRRELDRLIPRPNPQAGPPRRRRLLLAVTVFGAIVLVPWVVVLSASLPMTTSVGAWRMAWVGFDIALTAALALSAWTVWRRRQLALIALAVTVTLVTCDIWFDLCLSWGTPDQTAAVVSAVFAEIPLLIVLLVSLATMIRRTALVTQHLRGRAGEPPAPWRQTLVMVPPQQ